MRTFAEKPKATSLAAQQTTMRTGYARGDLTATGVARFGHDFSRIHVHSNAPADVQPGPMVNTPGSTYAQVAYPAESRSGRYSSGVGRHRSPVKITRLRETHIDSPFTELAQTPGKPMPESLQKAWGARLGADLSAIRLHPDSPAVSASGANAINWGNHIFLKPGVPDLHSSAGLGLIGHEVTHAMQTHPEGQVQPAGSVAELSLEAEAQQIGGQLAQPGLTPLSIHQHGFPAALRGDKQVNFSGTNITVSDTYVIHGAGATSAFLTRFQNALDTYYNSPSFTYRGYNVQFNLSVRMANYDSEGDMTDSSWDASTMIFTVATGSGREGGLGEITLYDSSSEATIAHEVGHYLSNRVGYFSERYSENLIDRMGSMLFDTPSTTTPDPGCETDIMATLSGHVTDCALSDFLDEQINAHEAAERERARMERLFREGGYMGHGDLMLPGGIVVPVGPKF